MGRDEVEAAYFTLLRARAEVDGLRRYDEMLESEARRVRRWASEGAALAGTVDARIRRALVPSDREIADALQRRLALIEEERGTLDDRIASAEAFVTECEELHRALVAARDQLEG